MAANLVEEIAAKAAALPPELQREALAFVEELAHREDASQGSRPFRSVRGLLRGDLSGLEDDLRAVREQAWGDFPREEPR